MMKARQERLMLVLSLAPRVMLWVGLVYFLAFLALNLVASPLSKLVRELSHDEELSRRVYSRFLRSIFLRGKQGVPRRMRKVRLSAKPNKDGTYWVMTMDAQFTTLSFKRYRAGEIREPNNPDSPSVKYPPGENPWEDMFGK